MARQEDGTVMLSAAKHLKAQRDRPFAALRVTRELCHVERSEWGDKKEPSHSTTCNLCSYTRPPSPYGILELCLRLTLIRAVKSAPTDGQIILLRQGSNALDSFSSTERSSPVMLSAAKHLAADRGRPFAALRVTRWDGSNCQVPFVHIEPCLNWAISVAYACWQRAKLLARALQ